MASSSFFCKHHCPLHHMKGQVSPLVNLCMCVCVCACVCVLSGRGGAEQVTSIFPVSDVAICIGRWQEGLTGDLCLPSQWCCHMWWQMGGGEINRWPLSSLSVMLPHVLADGMGWEGLTGDLCLPSQWCCPCCHLYGQVSLSVHQGVVGGAKQMTSLSMPVCVSVERLEDGGWLFVSVCWLCVCSCPELFSVFLLSVSVVTTGFWCVSGQ